MRSRIDSAQGSDSIRRSYPQRRAATAAALRCAARGVGADPQQAYAYSEGCTYTVGSPGYSVATARTFFPLSLRQVRAVSRPRLGALRTRAREWFTLLPTSSNRTRTDDRRGAA